jgi:hypothetical protein
VPRFEGRSLVVRTSETPPLLAIAVGAPLHAARLPAPLCGEPDEQIAERVYSSDSWVREPPQMTARDCGRVYRSANSVPACRKLYL